MKAPALVTQNRFDGLSVDNMTDCDSDTVVVSCNNGRGSQKSELGAPEACLIPLSNKPITKEPKEGVKDEKVFIRSMKMEREVFLNVMITTMDTHDSITVKALLDSGATGMFIDREFVHKSGLKTRVLPYPIKVYNVDGTLNQGGSITEEIMLMMSHRGHKEKAIFEVCDLGKATIIVGHPWLRKHNPEIDWKMGQVRLTCCPSECTMFI